MKSYYYLTFYVLVLPIMSSFFLFLFAFGTEVKPIDNTIKDVPNEEKCSLFYYLVSNSPCIFNISSENQTINIPINFEIIENDDNDSINYVTNYGNLYNNVTTVTLSQNEKFHMNKIGGNLPFDIFSLNIYMIPSNTENGKIIGIDDKSFNKIILQPYEELGEVYFKIPIISSYSMWKIIIEYEINDEVEGFYISPNFKINR